MPQLESDNFPWSDGNLATVSGGLWTKMSGFDDVAVVSNEVTGINSSGAHWNAWGGSTTDQYSQITARTVGGSGGPAIRADDTNTLYYLDIQLTAWEVTKIVAGSFTTLSSVAQTTSIGDLCYIEMQGTTIITKRNGSTVNTVNSESSIASGKPGLWFFGVAMKGDVWVAGDFGAAAAGPLIGGKLVGQGILGGRLVNSTAGRGGGGWQRAGALWVPDRRAA